MNAVWQWLAAGGATMAALAAVALALCFLIVERLLAAGRPAGPPAPAGPDASPRGGADGPAWTGLRRMGLIRACIIVAPLLGLLGTVTGIIETFQGVLAGGGVTEMSGGITKALRTTQYGLAIAACGLLGEQLLLRRIRQAATESRAAAAAGEGGV